MNIGFICLNKDINACRQAFSKYYLDYKPQKTPYNIHSIEKFSDPIIGRNIYLLYGGEEERLRGIKLDILEICVEFGTLTDINAFERINNAINTLKIANNDMEVRIYYISKNN